MTYRLSYRFASMVLAICILVSVFSGCGGTNLTQSSSDGIDPSEPISVSDNTSPSIAEMPDIQPSSLYDEPVNLEFIEGQLLLISDDWEDYIGDYETIVYGLLTNQLEYKYDVFPAYVELSNGTPVFGLAYTDYSECYTDSTETEAYFTAGFLSSYGEIGIPEEEFNSGLTIYNLDYENEATTFIWKYSSDPFQEHCVIYGQYLIYGVDESGQIFYENRPYDRDTCDEELGSLYSYDEGRYLLEQDLGNYTNIDGLSLSEQIDYDELERQINLYLESQDVNFAQIDIESNLYHAQEAVVTYLLSIQEESFLGYDVDLLVNEAQNLDPKECIRMTSDGISVVDIDDIPNSGAEPLVKWLVGTSCVILTAVGMVGSVVFIECPPLSAASGAVAGAAIDMFMQVVIENASLEEVNWSKVAMAAVTGAVSGYLGPYMMANFSGASYFVADSALDGLLGGIEHAATAWLDGDSGAEIAKQFGFGFALGFAMSAGFKAMGNVAEKIATKASPVLQKLGKTVFPNLSKKVSALSGKFGELIIGLKKVADASPFHSEYISKKLSHRELLRIMDEGSDGLMKKSFDSLKKDGIIDENGDVITKEALEQVFKTAEDGATIGYFKLDDELIHIVKKNGAVGIVFDPQKFQTVTLPFDLINNRNDNFAEAAKILKKQWLDDPSTMPNSLAEAIKNSGIELESMEPEKIVDIIRKSDWVLHENIDLKTVTLVSRSLHDKAEGGIAHMGGFALAKYLKEHMGHIFFERLVSSAASSYVVAVS